MKEEVIGSNKCVKMKDNLLLEDDWNVDTPFLTLLLKLCADIIRNMILSSTLKFCIGITSNKDSNSSSLATCQVLLKIQLLASSLLPSLQHYTLH
jgi:hypothetical protein